MERHLPSRHDLAAALHWLPRFLSRLCLWLVLILKAVIPKKRKRRKKNSLKLWPLTRSYFPPHCARPRSLSHPITRQDGRLLLTPPNTVRCRWHAVAMRPRLGERMLWICATRFQRITEDWPLALNPQFLDNLSFFRASYWAEKFTPSRVKMQSEDLKRFETVWFYVSEPVKKST